MDFLDRLRHLALSRGYSNNMQLSKASGVPYTTLDSFYRTGYDNVKLTTLRKLCDCLDCTLEYLVNGDPESEASPSSAALDIARKFDRLDEHSQAIVSALIDMELRRPALSMHEHFQAVYDSEYAAAIDDLLEAKQ